MPLLDSQQHHIVDVTELALVKLLETLAGQPEGSGIRLAVTGGGCAGLQYDMQPAEGPQDNDFIQVINGQIRLFIPPVAAAYLKGTQIDFVDAMMDGGFKFKNPNAESTCGCGTSFGV